MLGTRIPSSKKKIVEYKTMVLYAGYFPHIRPWSYKGVVLSSGNTGTAYYGMAWNGVTDKNINAVILAEGV